eukprot:6195532-Pleurochrysis_carterae.AAC.1
MGGCTCERGCGRGMLRTEMKGWQEGRRVGVVKRVTGGACEGGEEAEKKGFCREVKRAVWRKAQRWAGFKWFGNVGEEPRGVWSGWCRLEFGIERRAGRVCGTKGGVSSSDELVAREVEERRRSCEAESPQ